VGELSARCAMVRVITEGVLMSKLMVAIAALAIMSTIAHSETTVDQWIALCTCESYARGVADAVVAVRATRPQLSTSCIPAGATASDLVKLALPFAQGQPPAGRQLMAATLLMDVFHEAFPCPRQ
jgi:Rap1a immunity proteins